MPNVLLGQMMPQAGMTAPKAWWDAVDAGDLSAMKKLAIRGQYINARNDYSSTALIISVNENHTEVIDWLLSQKADLKIQTYNGYNALIAASSLNNAHVVKLALEAGVPINGYCEETNIYGKLPARYTAAHLAAANGAIESMKHLVKHGADMKLTNQDAQTPLGWSLVYGQIKMYRYLLSLGLKPTEHQTTGEHLIVYALLHNQPQIMRELAESEPFPVKQQYAEWFINTALERGFLTCAQASLETYRWKEQRPQDRAEQAFIAAVIEADVAKAKQLAQTTPHQWGSDFLPIAIRFASQRGNLDLVPALKSANQQMSLRLAHSKALHEPLLNAMTEKDYTRLEAYFSAGTTIDNQDLNGKMMLQLRLMKPQIDILKMLVKHGLRFDYDRADAARFYDSMVQQKHPQYAMQLLASDCTPAPFSLITAIDVQDQIAVAALLKYDWNLKQIEWTYRGRPVQLLAFAREKGSEQIVQMIQQAWSGKRVNP
tara:strand:- start:42399 stop:43856 length:1458 start_codon:yes stop_codon:yes gene_type:complete